MKRSYYKRLEPEDRFARRYCCWANNHHGWKKYKTRNQRNIRRKLNAYSRGVIGSTGVSKTLS